MHNFYYWITFRSNSLESNFHMTECWVNQILTFQSESNAKAKFMEIINHILHLFPREIHQW